MVFLKFGDDCMDLISNGYKFHARIEVGKKDLENMSNLHLGTL